MPLTITGIKPTGRPHLGNYLGMMQPALELARSGEALFFVADYHALTIPPAEQVREHVLDLAATLIAFGLDTERNILYRQSDLPELCELTWILGCTCPKGLLNRAHAYKAAVADNEAHGRPADQGIGAGLFSYPVLMAADILAHRAQAVPVGRDQRQHVEIARDIAATFNHRFGQTFVEPRALIREEGARIMALDEPEKKMSKSGAEASYIALLDPPDVIRKKIARATTDSQRDIVFDEKRPGIYNLLTIYQQLGGEGKEQIEAEFAGKGYKEFKAALADRVIATLEPIQRRFHELFADHAALDTLLAQGDEQVRPLAVETLRTAKERVGLL